MAYGNLTVVPIAWHAPLVCIEKTSCLQIMEGAANTLKMSRGIPTRGGPSGDGAIE
jgi:hypothetical protein